MQYWKVKGLAIKLGVFGLAWEKQRISFFDHSYFSVNLIWTSRQRTLRHWATFGTSKNFENVSAKKINKRTFFSLVRFCIRYEWLR